MKDPNDATSEILAPIWGSQSIVFPALLIPTITPLALVGLLPGFENVL